MSMYIINNFVHLLFAVIWIGGMIFMNLVLMPSLSSIDPNERGKLFAQIAKRFTIVAWGSTLLLLITGFFKTPSGMLFNFSTDYGMMITVKHILFLVMIIFGSIITFVEAPKIKKYAPKPGEKPAQEFVNAQGKIKLLSASNMILGIIILILVSIY